VEAAAIINRFEGNSLMREESVEEGPVAALLTAASRSGHSKEGSNVSHGGCATERTVTKSHCYPDARKLAFFLFYI
jgi:hypothetical protein